MKRVKLIILTLSLLMILGCESSAPDMREESPIENSGAEPISSVEKEAPRPASAIAKSTRPASDFGTDAFIQSLEKAKMVFNPPNQMLVDSTESMKLIIDLQKTFEALEKNFGEEEALSRREVLVSEQLEVKLSGSAFEIKPITPEKQYLSKLESTVWKWDVTAQKEGKHNLNLVIIAISSDGKDRVRTFDEIIQVNSLPFWDQVVAFIKSEYKWLFSAFIIPIFIWYIKSKKAKKEEKKESE